MSEHWQYIISSVIIGAMLLLAIIGLGISTVMPGMDRWSKRFFACFFAILSLCVCTFFVSPFTENNPSMLIAQKVADYFETLLGSILIVMPTLYLIHCCGEDWHKSTLFRTILIILFVFFVILSVSPFTTLFYYYSPNNEFHTGPWYPLPMSLMAAILIISLEAVVRRRNKLSIRRFYAFLIFLVPLTIAVVVHIISPSFLLVYAGLTTSSLAMYIFVMSDQIEQYMNLQQEATRQRAKIAVLQMRPHFIHNTMTSIYYLCDQDPKKAQQVTMDFNTYLRKNFNAIAKDETIPFAEELEHTRAYLAVEQAQFESKLVVDYDVPHTQFRVPPLTLQPLAENAVKHGMGPNNIPLHVTIRTQKVGSINKVVVEDNGPGFDPAIANDPQTTLANIRQRLDMMCGGKLEFESRKGGGTVARVTIPQ